MRLVKENSPLQMVDRALAHIRKQGYFIVDRIPIPRRSRRIRESRRSRRAAARERGVANRSRRP
jgi:hypothetical protein